MHSLLVLEPGHFHAALVLRVPNSRIDPDVRLYARPGPERNAFVALFSSFNARDDRPTGWNVRIHDSPDLERLRAPPRSPTARKSIAMGSIERRLAVRVRAGFTARRGLIQAPVVSRQGYRSC